MYPLFLSLCITYDYSLSPYVTASIHTVTRLSHDLADAEQLFNSELAVGQQFLALHL